jgi:putative DNA primase/helicase
MSDLAAVARALGGVVVSNTSVSVPGPGHSTNDRSLSIKLDPTANDGFVLHSFAGDSTIACRDHIRAALGLSTSKPISKAARLGASPSVVAPVDSSIERSAFALHLWNAACDPRGTVVADYLSSRELMLPDDVAAGVIRYHPSLKYNGNTVGGMVALFRDIKTNIPCGVQRTFLDGEGCKLGRAMLGRVKHAAIKIDADEDVTLGLTIGEGFETGLAARLAGFRPVWATGSAGGITNFPVLAGVEALTILGEVGDGGVNHRASQTCAARWMDAGKEAFIVTPLVGDDLNDAWREVAP